MDNRRRDERFPVSLAVEMSTPDGAVKATIQNMSASGMGFYMEQALEPGLEVTLGLILLEDGIEDPDTAPLALRGEAMWCESAGGGRGYLAGVRFTDLAGEAQQRLEAFLERINS